MSIFNLRIIIAGVLFLHGIAHIGPLIVVLTHDRWKDTGAWKRARSWLFPALAPSLATTLASTLYTFSLLVFVAAALSFWGVLIPGEAWRSLALVASIISTLGILLFLGTWPIFNTLAALAVNVAVLITQLWTHWPPFALFGK
jgi:hypothetical protein